MNAPRKAAILIAILVTIVMSGYYATPAGAGEQLQLITVKVQEPRCSANGTAVHTLTITNATEYPINTLAVDMFGNEHHVVELPGGDSVSFEFETGLAKTEGWSFEVDAAIPGHEDDPNYAQVITGTHPGLDCHKPQSTDAPNDATSNTTTTSLAATAPQPDIGTALAITREKPTISASKPVSGTAPEELAYTGSRQTEILVKVALTCLVLGLYLLFQVQQFRARARRKQRRANIAKARQS